MRSRALASSLVIFLASIALLGGALAYAAQPVGVQEVPPLTVTPSAPARVDLPGVYLPLVLADAVGGARTAQEPGADRPPTAPTSEPVSLPEAAPTSTSPEPTLPTPETPLTDTVPLADLPVVPHCGAIAANETWAGGYVHRLTCGVTVNNGVVLTVAAGAVVKFNAGLSLSVNGTLNAEGTSDSLVYFTSIKDDTVGGDTNGDGSASAPAKGDWLYIALNSSGRASFNHAVLRYGGHYPGYGYGMVQHSGGSLSISNSSLSHASTYGIYASAPLTVTASTITNNSSAGIYAANVALTVSGSTISHNNGNGVSANGPLTVTNSTIAYNGSGGIYADASPVTISGSTVTNNSGDGVYVRNPGALTLTNTALTNNTGYAAQLYLSSAGLTTVPTLTGATATGNGVNGLGLSGSVTTTTLP